VDFASLGEIHLRYIKGLPGPYCVATAEIDKDIQQECSGEPISQAEYHELVEQTLDPCRCGGTFRFDAPARCPKCRTTELDLESRGPGVDYD